jgi:hypothetical protein
MIHYTCLFLQCQQGGRDHVHKKSVCCTDSATAGTPDTGAWHSDSTSHAQAKWVPESRD